MLIHLSHFQLYLLILVFAFADQPASCGTWDLSGGRGISAYIHCSLKGSSKNTAEIVEHSYEYSWDINSIIRETCFAR